MRLPGVILLLLIAGGGPCLRMSAAPASETWTVGGKTFERVRVVEVNAATVMIAHAGGLTQLDLATLSPELQQRFHYDPANAEAWKRDAAAGMAATEQIKQRQTVEQARRAELEQMKQRIVQREEESQSDHVEVRNLVDLRPVFAEHSLYLKNQGRRPSCTIFAVVSALEYDYARGFGDTEPLSEEFLIWAFQKAFPGKSIDNGYNFDEVLMALRQYGVARRSMLPDSFASYLRDADPPEAAIEDARNRRAFSMVRFAPRDENLVSKMVDVLNKEHLVILGIGWPAPSTIEHQNLLRDQAPQAGPAHAVTLVGYQSDGTLDGVVFIYRNSYGPQWGEGGYGFMAASYLKKNVMNAFCLIVRQVPQAAP